MKGIRYLTDDAGIKTGVVLDLRRHRRIWEDIHDRLLVESRRNEPRKTLSEVKAGLARRSAKK